MNNKRTTAFAAIIFISVCVLIGTLFYLKFMTVNDEERFTQVLADMQQLKTDLTKDAPTADWQLQSTCDQAHEVYNKGGIGCTVAVAYQVPVPDESTMQTIVTGFTHALAQAAPFTQTTHKVTQDALSFITTRQPGSVGDVYRHVRSGMQCSSYIGITHDKPYVFAALFQCTGQAQRMYFSKPSVG